MQQYGLVHPRMLPELIPDFYASLCTITDLGSPPPRNQYGEATGTPLPVSGLVDIPCRIAPRSSREVRQPAQIYATATHHVALAGCFLDEFGLPMIKPRMLAAVDGYTYEIEGYEDDGNDKTSRLYVRQVKN